jgi:hypothetical protein
MRAALLAAALVSTTTPHLVRPHPSRAVGMVDGVVTDTGLSALGEATVTILGSKVRVVTGANGRFRIRSLATGSYILVVHHVGYTPASTAIQITGSDTLRPAIILAQIVTPLDTVVVAAKQYTHRMAEFEERRKLGFGQFMTQAQIEARNVPQVGDLLRGFMSVYVGQNDKTATNMRAGCAFQLVVDGIPLPPSTHGPRSLDEVPIPHDLAGIEVYANTAHVPLQYKTKRGDGSICGVIVFWTRGGH